MQQLIKPITINSLVINVPPQDIRTNRSRSLHTTVDHGLVIVIANDQRVGLLHAVSQGSGRNSLASLYERLTTLYTQEPAGEKQWYFAPGDLAAILPVGLSVDHPLYQEALEQTKFLDVVRADPIDHTGGGAEIMVSHQGNIQVVTYQLTNKTHPHPAEWGKSIHTFDQFNLFDLREIRGLE